MDAGKDFLKEFIDCYELSESLWDSTSPDYTSRHIKMAAYNQLLKIMKKYKKDASVTDVKKKINTLRSNFRREMKRIKKSQARGDQPLYTPNLWWFEHISFLKKLKSSKPSNALLKHEEVYVDEFVLDDEEENQEQDESAYNLDIKLEGRKPKRHLVEETYTQTITPKLKKQDDSSSLNYNIMHTSSGGDTIDHMCRAWAGNLREMGKQQRIIAERAISEIIFQGQVGVLTFDSIPKMTVNAPFPSSQMTLNITRLSEDPNEYSSPDSQDINCQQSRTETRDTTPPKSTPRFTTVDSHNQRRPSLLMQPQKSEYTSREEEHQSFTTIHQPAHYYN